MALLKADEVAERLAVTKQYVYALGRRGVLRRIVLPGGVIRFDETDVDALVESGLQQGEPEHPQPTTRRRRQPKIPARF